MRNLVIRADGGEKIGLGHLMRCRALAQAWEDTGGGVRFASAGESAVETAAIAASVGAEWVVVDGYHFGSDYVDTLQRAGLRVLFIDDYGHADHYPAELVLNQNLHACDAFYADRSESTGLLLGSRYSLLRREFLHARRDSTIPPVARKLLITLGGGDPHHVTAKVLRAVASLAIADLEVIVVRHAPAKLPFPARVERDPANMAELMAWADVAVSAAGSTCWELAFMGLPAIAIVCADNQQAVAESLHQAGSIDSLGAHSMLSSRDIAAALKCLLRSQRIRRSMAERGRAIVDGCGAARVVERMLRPVHFRAVEEQDCRLLWEWVNDPAARTSAFSSDPVPWPSHVQWFRNKRHDPRTIQWIALDAGGLPIGQVRFDGETIDISVAPEQRAKGYGRTVIAAAVEEFFRTTSAETVHALVKTRNQPSLRAFLHAGFQDVGIESVNGQEAEHLVRRRQDA
jgi:UDP-2,4-diacetamido-2,4,6-trideoxy-beta-L-altropyranose hydrolase